jgi:glycosyl hydrolase family 42 (putative beta-galactosidase)
MTRARVWPTRFYVLTELLLILVVSGGALLAPAAPARTTEPMQLGFTFSQLQASYLDISYQTAYQRLMQLSPAVVRLAAYWNEIEPRPGEFDFSSLDWLVGNTPAGTRVVLTLGMKAPRWPEYFIPTWLEQANNLPDGVRVSDDEELRAALPTYVLAVVEHYRQSPAITYWQVENEPLDPSGPRLWTIGQDVLEDEIALVRELDPLKRPVVVTTFVETNPVRQLPGLDDGTGRRVRTLTQQADIVGLDLYPVRGAAILGKDVFVRWPAFVWQHQVRSIQRMLAGAGKQAWITEVQAEPWLVTHIVYLDRLPRPEIVPSEMEFVVSQIRASGFDSALLWGAEYWYMRMQRFDDARWWSTAQQLAM